MTERLSPTDAAFLFLEDSSTPLHVGGVVVLQPGRPDFQYSDLFDLISSRLSLVPRFRQRVRFVPGRIARPVWVDDENFDLTYHVRRSALPAPGTDEQLTELVGRLISRPLDRTRPLWEIYVIEGLQGGRIALVNKTHHAMVDRIGAVDLAAAILDISPSPRALPEQVWLPTPAPSDADLVVDAIADLTSRPSDILDVVKLAALDVRSAVAGLSSGLSGAWELARRTVRPAPRSPLNVPVSGQRRFAAVSVDLAAVKKIRKVHSGTVNDVILTALTGALRSWLLARGEPVTAGTTVRAMLPVSIREEGPGVDPVVSYLVDLPVSEPNPVMRLHQVSFAMAAHTESGQGVGADALMGLGRFAPPTLHALGARVGSQLSRRVYNLLVTNVPGPQIPLYAAGALVVAMYPVASLAPGQALALSVTSYNGTVYFGLTADRDAMPDVDEFGAHIREAVEELLGTVNSGHGRRPGPPGTSPTGKNGAVGVGTDERLGKETV
ncbi:wax ester/triacylglycerol synthase family O-acyltransferase [Nakamurella silvestris]|nr:wax ester/triacylglycerol synthase family O-acyltransferase [Nakamurella silvestris]